MTATNPWRFSTKLYDSVWDLVHYEYRVYSPGLHVWLSRDPIGEEHVQSQMWRSQEILGLYRELTILYTGVKYRESIEAVPRMVFLVTHLLELLPEARQQWDRKVPSLMRFMNHFEVQNKIILRSEENHYCAFRNDPCGMIDALGLVAFCLDSGGCMEGRTCELSQDPPPWGGIDGKCGQIGCNCQCRFVY